jgi:transglutaminase/protease-like cytokinesis protein 3
VKRVGLLLLCVVGLIVDVRAQLEEFRKADSVAGIYPGHPLDDLGLLSKKLASPLSTDREKFRAIYKWVCSNVQSDYELTELHKRKRAKLKGEDLEKWNKRFAVIVNRILLDQYKTLCFGYAWLVRELAMNAGIRCEIVNGYGRSVRANLGGNGIVNHSWNAVELDGKWYLCDATWSSGGVTKTNVFVHDFKEPYFLAAPEFFILNHYPLETKWTLLNDPPSLQTFLNAPLIYANAYKHKVKPIEPATFRMTVAKGDIVSFKLSNDQFQRQLFQKKGTYAFHVMVKDDVVASYEITVK